MATYENINEKVESIKGLIPDNCMSFFEQSLYVAEHAEKVTNEMFASIGIEELAVYESTGSTVVYEGAKLDQFKTTIKTTFNNIWGAIKSAYEKVMNFFEEKKKNAVESLKGMTIMTSADVDKFVKEDYKGGKVHKYDVDCIDFEANVKKFVSNVEGAFASVDYSDKAAFDDLKNDLMDSMVKNIAGVDAKSVKEAKKEVHSKMMGEQVEITRAWLKDNMNEVINVVTKGESVKDIKKAYKAEKQNIDKAISSLNRKLTSRKDENMNGVTQMFVLYKASTQCFHSMMSIKMDVVRNRMMAYTSIMVKMAAIKMRGSVGKKKEEKVEESAFTPATSQVDLIEAAFQW